MTLKQAKRLKVGDKVKIKKHTPAVIKALTTYCIKPYAEDKRTAEGSIWTIRSISLKEVKEATTTRAKAARGIYDSLLLDNGYYVPIICLSKI